MNHEYTTQESLIFSSCTNDNRRSAAEALAFTGLAKYILKTSPHHIILFKLHIVTRPVCMQLSAIL